VCRFIHVIKVLVQSWQRQAFGDLASLPGQSRYPPPADGPFLVRSKPSRRMLAELLLDLDLKGLVRSPREAVVSCLQLPVQRTRHAHPQDTRSQQGCRLRTSWSKTGSPRSSPPETGAATPTANALFPVDEHSRDVNNHATVDCPVFSRFAF